MSDLTPKQARFVEEYLVDLNGTQAAIRAGYSPNTAQEIASQNLSKLIVQSAVAEAKAKLSQRVEVTQEMVMAEFAKIGFSDIRSLFDASGRLKPLCDLSAEQAASIATVEVVTKTIPGRDGEPADVEYTHKIRAWDKVAALTQMGRRLGMFVDKSEVKVTAGLAERVEAARKRKAAPK